MKRIAVALAISFLSGCGSRGHERPFGPATADRVLQAVREPGAKAVLVNVWGTWCAPCRAEFPGLMQVARELRPEGLRVVLVSADFDESLPKAREFLAEHGV